MSEARGGLLGWVAFGLCVLGLPAVAAETRGANDPRGSLTENLVIESAALGYDLQYRVYTPPGKTQQKLPSIYVTDGQWYLASGEMVRLLDRLIKKGSIEPVIAVFIDNRDPKSGKNRRNSQFFCNERYASFVAKELVPAIDTRYPTSKQRGDRAVLGLSFGGLNSACFGLQIPDTFGGVAMQSPALHPVPNIFEDYQNSSELDVRFFLSTGTRGDNEESSRRLKRILNKKGYDLRYIEVPQGHNWRNWKPLLDDVLKFFFSD